MAPSEEVRRGLRTQGGGPLDRARAAIGRVVARFTDREDSEHEQALIRLALGLLACVYLLIRGTSSAAADYLLWMILAFLTGSLLVILAIVVRPGSSPSRRYLGMCLDFSAVSAAMGVTGEAGAPLLAIYLWVIVGNGFRYGRRYLWAAAALGITGFGAVFLFSDFWSAHPVFSVSFLIVLMLIPAYVAALLEKLNQAIVRANEASQAKSRFLAKMSHELRTPLNGVIGMADLLMDARLPPREEGFAHTIQESAKTLLGIIENILDFSKIEAGRIAIESVDFDLHRLATDTLEMFRPQAERKGLRLILHMDPRVPFRLRGDPLHLRQVLLNLIGNAVKFTEAGWVKLRVQPASRSYADGRIGVRFEIEDTGIGIAREDQHHIFESFRQARVSIARRYGGTGLGTAIARELVLLMDGDIGLSSDPGRGSLFWVELPLRPQSRAAEGIGDGLAGTRVLVLGDAESAASVAGFLSDWGMDTTQVMTSARAFAELLSACEQARPYGVLLVGARGLDLDPRQLAAGVRGEPRLADLGMILVDASPALGSEASLLEAGFAGVLPSPLYKTQLFNAIHLARSTRDAGGETVSLAERYRRLGTARRAGLRILVAEDNETNRLVLQGILERVGHRPVLVEDGEGALDLLAADPGGFDLMILDKNMPGRTGLEVYLAHRFMTRAPIPAILLTADATPEALTECNAAGVDAYLTKPVDTLALLSTIARVAGRAGEGGDEEPAAPSPAAPGDDLLDEGKLRSLLALGRGSSFFDELVGVFERDSERGLAAMVKALAEEDYPALRAAIHALRGSASEIGASRILDLCTAMRALKPFELGSSRAAGLVADLRRAQAATAVALRAFPSTSGNAAAASLVRGPWPLREDARSG